jgi:hypothetical protein
MLVNVPPGSSLSCRGHGSLFTSKSDYLRGFPQDVDLSEVWLSRDQFGMTFLDQLGLMDMSDLLELSKGLSKIGAKIFESMWFKLRT